MIQRPRPDGDWFISHRETERLQKKINYFVASYLQGIPQRNYHSPVDYIDGFISSMRTSFQNKCPYCEVSLTGLADTRSMLSWFRPIGGARGLHDIPDFVDKPHYFWLEWTWANLYLTCPACQIAKDSLFPVDGERALIGTKHEDLASESALLLDPCDLAVNPLDHLRFLSNGTVQPLNESKLGRTTIDVLQLSRTDLIDRRRAAAEAFIILYDECVAPILPRTQATVDISINKLINACAFDKEFAGLKRWMLWDLLRKDKRLTRPRWVRLREQLSEWIPLAGIQSIQSESELGTTPNPPVSPAKPVSIDFIFITVLDDERTALLERLPGHRRLPARSDDIHIYYEATVPVRSADGFQGSYNVIVCQFPGMGRARAAAATRDIVQQWRPRHLMLVGIAGGIAAHGVAQGDVLVATQIVDYELQKMTPAGSQVRWEVFRTDERLCNTARHLGDGWLLAVRAARPASGIPKVHFGPVASGDKVIAFEEVLRQHRDHWPALNGVEMEAAGIATANFQSSTPLPFFQVRGVSDLADRDKSDGWRNYACAVAATYAIALLESGPVPPANQDSTDNTHARGV